MSSTKGTQVLLFLVLALVFVGGLLFVANNANQSMSPTPQPTTIVEDTPCKTSYQHNLEVSTSSSLSGYCTVRQVYDWGTDKGYQLVVPKSWKYDITGAAANSLTLSSNEKPLIYIGVVHTDSLAFNNYDKATYAYELSAPSPVIDAAEKIQDKQVITKGVNKYLKVTTDKSVYYFTDNSEKTDKAIYYIHLGEDVDMDGEIMEDILTSFLPIRK